MVGGVPGAGTCGEMSAGVGAVVDGAAGAAGPEGVTPRATAGVRAVGVRDRRP